MVPVDFPAERLRRADAGLCWYHKAGGQLRGPVREATAKTLDANTLVRHRDHKQFLRRGDAGAFPQGWLDRAKGLREGNSVALHEAFIKYDVDGSYTIDAEEVVATQLLHGLQCPVEVDRAEFDAADADKDGALEFEEFIAFMNHVAPDLFKDGMWYYADDEGAEQGPVPQRNIQAWMALGYLTPESLVRHERDEGMRPAGKDFPKEWLGRRRAGTLEAAAGGGGGGGAGWWGGGCLLREDGFHNEVDKLGRGREQGDQTEQEGPGG